MIPFKTPLEQSLSNHYKIVMALYEIVPQTIIDQFKIDVERVKKQKR